MRPSVVHFMNQGIDTQEIWYEYYAIRCHSNLELNYVW
jgi:hypothetical protein